jgi:DNA-binding IclR family transcriptional regulator
MKSQSDRSIQSLDRAFDILNTLGQAGSKGLSLKDICAVTKLHPSTAHHLISTMVSRGYLSQDSDSRRYALGPALLQLRTAALDGFDLQASARPYAQDLLDRTGESIYLSILRGWDFPAVIMLPSPNPVRFVRPPTTVPCLHSAAAGKCLLAYQQPAVIEHYIREVPLTRFTSSTIVDADALRAELANIRALGITFDREEHAVGGSCIAAPIFNDHGDVVASLSLSAPTFRATPEKFAHWTADVREVAAALSARLGFAPTERVQTPLTKESEAA